MAPRISKRKEDRIVALYRDGKSISAIQRKLRLGSWSTVAKALERRGVSRQIEVVGEDGVAKLGLNRMAGRKYIARISVGSFTEMVKILVGNKSSENKRLLRKLRAEDRRAYDEALAELDKA